jgi:hypothetical protein
VSVGRVGTHHDKCQIGNSKVVVSERTLFPRNQKSLDHGKRTLVCMHTVLLCMYALTRRSTRHVLGLAPFATVT